MPELSDVTASSIHADDPQKQIESVVNQVNEGFRAISNEARTNITKDDAGTERLLIGYQENGFSNGNVGIKLSQEGVDVLSATSDQLVFSSDFNIFKIALTGTASKSPPAAWVPGANQRVTVPHNLGYKPAHLVYVDNPDLSGFGYISPGLSILPGTIHLTASFDPVFTSYAFVDETNLYIDLQYFNSTGGNANGFDTETWNYRYYILQETAS